MAITFDVIFGVIFAIAGFIGFGVSINQIRKGFNYLFYQYSAGAWFCAGVDGIFYALGNLLFSVPLYEIALILGELSCLFTILCADTLKREQGEPVKIAIILTLIALAIVTFILIPDAVSIHTYPTGDQGLYPDLIVGFIFVGAGTISFVYYYHCAHLVNARAPNSLKKYSRVYATGVFLVLAATLCFAITQPYFPGSAFLIYSAGGLLMAYAYGSEPKLIFVLPFKAIRLTVLEAQSGLSLFTHTWNAQDNLADETLFSGMVQGISMFVQESLRRGSLQEIRVEGAIIISYRVPRYPVAFVLVATRPSRSLRDGLQLFAKQFCRKFEDKLTESLLRPGVLVNQFDGAKSLVATCFPHIPVYD